MDEARERGVSFEAVYRLATPAGRTTLGKIVSVAHADWLAEQSVSPTPTMITIPANATAEDLIAEAEATFVEAGIPFTFFNWNVLQIIRHDLELVRGKTLQVLTHVFGQSWTMREGRDLQKAQGFDGNAAAFLVWVVQAQKMGGFVSIANTDDRLIPCGGYLDAPFFLWSGSYRQCHLFDHRHEWSGFIVLVAFRAI